MPKKATMKLGGFEVRAEIAAPGILFVSVPGGFLLVWKVMQDGVLSDDGAAIDSSWTTKDFTAGLAFNNKVFREVWVGAAAHAASSMTVSYAVDKSATFTDKTVPLNESSDYVNKIVQPEGDFPIGKTVKLKFGNNAADQYMRVNSYLLYVEPRGRQVP